VRLRAKATGLVFRRHVISAVNSPSAGSAIPPLSIQHELSCGGGGLDEVIFFPVSLNRKCAVLDRGEYRSLRLYGFKPVEP
jgi:hypothetical protein